ncbi:MAG: acyl-CoA dehydrogenase family protein [Solirubrobacteraceae bacterium]
MSVQLGSSQEFLADVRRVASEMAAAHADEVDRDARFPVEAFDALREVGALGAMVPEQHGGPGMPLETIASACYELGRACASTGMVYAMHQIQVATIARHLNSADGWFESYLRELVAEERLIASATSEVGTGGDMARSIAAIKPAEGGLLQFEKQATVVSYGAHAQDLLTSVRRSEGSEPGDQVMVLTRCSETELEQTTTWDTMGMRGTCSPGFVVRAKFAPEQVLGVPFSAMMTESFVPLSHLLWAHVWLGTATQAFDRGRAFVREAARRKPGAPVPAAQALAGVMAELAMFRSEVETSLGKFIEWSDAPGRGPMATVAAQLRFNNTKLAASQQVSAICAAVLEAIGIVAYKNDSPFAVGRQLRDALSARLMVTNERIRAVDAGLLTIAKEV